MNQAIASAPVSVSVSDLPEAPAWFLWATGHRAHSAFVEANGNRLHYFSWNPQDVDKPVLLLVHGFRAHARWWDFIAPFLMATHRVIALDLSGMGQSGWREAYSATLLSLDICGFVDALGLDGVTVVAHSYGGLCALRAASMRPALFGRIIALDTFVIFEDEELPVEPARIGGGRTYPDLETARQRYRLLPAQPVPDITLLDYIATHSLRAVDDGWRWKFDPRLQGYDTHLHDGTEMLGKITAPVDYIYGDSSALVKPEHARRVCAALTSCRGPIPVLQGHHHLMLDQPLALIATLRALLA